MTIQTAIEKAIEGGWNNNNVHGWDGWKVVDKPVINLYVRMLKQGGGYQGADAHDSIYLPGVLIDPKWWQALGRTEGWCDSNVGLDGACVDCGFKTHGPVWLMNMHDLIDALAEGKSLEEYFESL